MKGIVKYKDGKDGWEIREIERKDPGPEEVEIKIAAAGICGSELHLYHDNHYYTPGTVIGHEYSGVISRVGSHVKGWNVGDRVVTENHFGSCGSCYYCRTGNQALCKTRGGVGYHRNGGWAEYLCAPTKYMIRIPDSVTMEEATMVEPLAVLTEALCVKHPVLAGETVLVQGCGTIGLLAAQVAKAAGAGKVIITGMEQDEEQRLPIARSLKSIDRVVNVEREDLAAVVMELTGGEGADTVVEATGSRGGIASSIELARRLGRVLAIGETPAKEVGIDWNRAIFKALTLNFNFGSNYIAWHTAVDMIAAGTVEVKPLITHRIHMSEFMRGFQLMDEKKAIKVVMKAF